MTFIPYIPDVQHWNNIKKPIGSLPIKNPIQSGRGSADIEVVTPLEQVVVRAKAELKEEQKEEVMKGSSQSTSPRRTKRTSHKKRSTKRKIKKKKANRKSGKRQRKSVKRCGKKRKFSS